MAKKNKVPIILVIILLVGAFFLIPKNPENFSSVTRRTQLICEDERIQQLNDGHECVSNCIQITQQIADCMLNKGSGTYRKDVGEWVVYYDRIQSNENSCSEVWTDEASKSKTLRTLTECSTEFKDSLSEPIDDGTDDTDDTDNTDDTDDTNDTGDDTDDFFNKYKTQLIIGGIVLLGVVVLTKK